MTYYSPEQNCHYQSPFSIFDWGEARAGVRKVEMRSPWISLTVVGELDPDQEVGAKVGCIHLQRRVG
ncbi:Hypothetical protein FKW44_012211 [Caligus rogercresseyi]|uniref:Uncharacterized protein n=1 Tax=Caligus rogercresseyi TaxID=217165 RepID=A0A7T8HJ39_CALRO|nr:Hypothetical protein FKW44_012211 [Caligus rogercresseyi]